MDLESKDSLNGALMMISIPIKYILPTTQNADVTI